MVNAERGEVALTINGKTYTLVLKTAGLIAIQKRLSPAGKTRPLVDVIAELDRSVKAESLEHIVVFLWAALQKYHKGMTEDDAINLIDDAGGIPGLDAVFSELSASMTPDAEDVKELTPKRPRKAQARRT
jgi:hypothetical protein